MTSIATLNHSITTVPHSKQPGCMTVSTRRAHEMDKCTKSATDELRLTSHSRFSRFVERPAKLGMSFGSSSPPYLQSTSTVSTSILLPMPSSVIIIIVVAELVRAVASLRHHVNGRQHASRGLQWDG